MNILKLLWKIFVDLHILHTYACGKNTFFLSVHVVSKLSGEIFIHSFIFFSFIHKTNIHFAAIKFQGLWQAKETKGQ